MNIILSFSIIGISCSIFLGSLFLSKGKGKLISNLFLGLFFLLLAIRLGKLIVQEYAHNILLNTYFNLIHASFLAIGPVIWLYICSYLSVSSFKKTNKIIHFIPSLFFFLGAFHIRQIIGEQIWVLIYWVIQVHPILYVLKSLKFLIQSPNFKKNRTSNEKIWIYSLLATISFITCMNILYFTLNFPFYLVTALLLIMTVYLFMFLAFNNNLNIIIGKSGQKYKNLNLDQVKINLIRNKIDDLLLEQELYLNDQIKISDISDKLDVSSHIVSSVINKSYKISFPQYVNLLRIRKSQQILTDEKDKKIITVALESGFSSLSAFNRAFKKNSLMNPSTYRAKFLVKKAPDL